MVATVIINRKTGAGPSNTDITSINSRANAEDTHTTAGTANPVRIPAAGTNYSFWVTTRLEATVAPTGTIDNIRWFFTGTPDTGIGYDVGDAPNASYVQATGVVGTSGDQLTQGNHAGLSGAPVDATTFTSGSPKSVTGSITASTGEFGDLVVWQLNVDNTASPGPTSSITLTYRYDET